ncbi:MAG TPA: hypothetical protein VFN44_23500 [Solirubrobacteraceae bacterium]|nr:hypothetical protein [Solirubrobacteraceae bacterium]
MATTPAAGTRDSSRGSTAYPPEGAGWVLFAGIMIMMVGVLNIIWGIAAIDKASFFVQDAKFVISDLQTWGWIVLILGALQLLAAFSIWAGGGYGRWFGIATATFNAIAALLSIPAYPFWALAIFAVDILIVYALAAYGGDRRIAAG